MVFNCIYLQHSSSRRIFFILFLAIVATAEEPQSQFNRPPTIGTTSGFTVGKQYNLDAKVLKDGTTSGSLYALLGGQVGPGPTYFNQADLTGSTRDAGNTGYYAHAHAVTPEQSSSLWSSSNVNYYVAGGVFVVILLCYGLWAYFFSPAALRIAADVAEEEDEVADTKKDTKVVSKKVRRRRAIRKNEEAARLASIVLNAIASGECLQKSICIMGSQIGGTERGKLISNLLMKLIPESVQTNNYYVTLQKSLHGESYCNKFRCEF